MANFPVVSLCTILEIVSWLTLFPYLARAPDICWGDHCCSIMSCVMRHTREGEMLRFQDKCSVYFQTSAGLFDGIGTRGQGVAFYLSTHRWGCTSMIFFVFHFYLKSRHYSTSENKGYSQTTSLHLTRLFELRKSCWELCDSQRVWKSQIVECFSRKIGRFFSETHFCDE